MRLVVAFMLFATPLSAQEKKDDQQSEEQLKKELEGALNADQKAPQPAPAAATAAAAAAAPGGPPGPGPLARGTQSLNPDLSAILDADAGFQRRPFSFLNGDDPDLKASPGTRALGLTAQEVELAFSAIVDPYFKGEVFLTIPNLEGIEVEEAFATTTSLPLNFQVKGGSFRGAFGRQNGQHLHIQDFTRRPLINAAFLGSDGMRGPGVQVSWLAPLPFYLTVYGEAFSLRDDTPSPTAGDIGPVAPVESFGADGARRPTAAGEAKAFFPFGDEWSFYAGASIASGSSPGIALAGSTRGTGRDTILVGTDMYLKWKPANVSGGYSSVALQAETIFRHFTSGDGLDSEWDGGMYAQIVAQVSRRWFLGVRGDLIGLPTSSLTGRTERAGVSLTFQASEFARVRAYGEYEHAETMAAGALLPTVRPGDGLAAVLQLEISIGAHGAHPF
jgi:hypothetical protein